MKIDELVLTLDKPNVDLLKEIERKGKTRIYEVSMMISKAVWKKTRSDVPFDEVKPYFEKLNIAGILWGSIDDQTMSQIFDMVDQYNNASEQIS